MTAKKKPAPALKLRVGGVYVDGDGNQCHIVSANPYTDHYGMRYQKSGRCDSEWRKHDLIREVGAPKPKAAKPVMGWMFKAASLGLVGRTYSRRQDMRDRVPMHEGKPVCDVTVVRVKIVEVRR